MRSPLTPLCLAAALAACDGARAASDAAAVDRPDVIADDLVDATPPSDAAPDVAPDLVDVAAREGGGACSFNRDCPADERCACSESDGCHCTVGARGTGRAGVDTCASGDDCESALCVEASGSVSRCSAPCASPADCPAALPRCLTVPTVGSFCARDPSASTDAGASISLTARFGANTAGFEHAQHGVDGADGVYVEAHAGGDPACPTESSPTPRRTLIVRGVHAGVAGAQTLADGVTVSLLDFGGDLVSAPVVRASAAQVTVRAATLGVSVSLDVSATFAGGTIEGTLVAPHCASLDGP